MDKKQYEILCEMERVPVRASSKELRNQEPRTLIYGYTCDRDTFHVYLGEDGIHLVVYNYHGMLALHCRESEGIPLEDCVPDKRVYPEACDYEFCLILKRAGVNIPFTTWSEGRETALFHGKRVEELVTKYRPADFQLPRQPFEVLVEQELYGGKLFINEEMVASLVELTHSVAQSYLQALIPALPRNDVSRAEGWLNNLPGSIDHVFTRYEGFLGVEPLTEEQKAMVVSRVRDLVQPKLAELLAR